LDYVLEVDVTKFKDKLIRISYLSHGEQWLEEYESGVVEEVAVNSNVTLLYETDAVIFR